jgi:hypothetical protein
MSRPFVLCTVVLCTMNRPPVVVLDLREDCSVSVPNSKINLRLRWICVVK